MQNIAIGETGAFRVSGAFWQIEHGEAFFGSARFDLRAVSGRADAFDLDWKPEDGTCVVAARAAGAVAVLTARQVTTRGRILSHAWALCGQDAGATPWGHGV